MKRATEKERQQLEAQKAAVRGHLCQVGSLFDLFRSVFEYGMEVHPEHALTRPSYQDSSPYSAFLADCVVCCLN